MKFNDIEVTVLCTSFQLSILVLIVMSHSIQLYSIPPLRFVAKTICFLLCQFQSIGHKYSCVPVDLLNPVGGTLTWSTNKLGDGHAPS